MKKFLPDLTALCLAAQITLASAPGLWAEAPPGYYVTAEGQSGQALRFALHQIINDHHVIPYSGGATDVTAALKILDQALLATTDTNSWEPPEAVKGAIARSLFYMDVRYEGDRPNEQDLKLTDTTGQISSSTNFMGSLQTLLAWVPTRIRSSDLSLAHSDILRRIVAKPLPNAVGKALPTDYLTSRKVAHVIFEYDGILLALSFLYTPALNPEDRGLTSKEGDFGIEENYGCAPRNAHTTHQRAQHNEYRESNHGNRIKWTTTDEPKQNVCRCR